MIGLIAMALAAATPQATYDAAEAYLQRHVIDRGSATIEWPYEFVHVADDGGAFMTCGYIDSKDLEGHWQGPALFIIEVRDDGVIRYTRDGERAYHACYTLRVEGLLVQRGH